MKNKTLNGGVAVLATALIAVPFFQTNSQKAYAINVETEDKFNIDGNESASRNAESKSSVARIMVSNKDTAEDIAKKIKQAEVNEFAINNYFGKTKLTTSKTPVVNKQELGYNYIKGTKNILISAPHTLKQPARPGKSDYKVADAYTGGIAQYVAEKTGAHVIYKTSYTGEDDNFKGYGISNPTKDQTSTPYRDKIEDIIKENQIALVIDIHGFADDSSDEYGIELGTNNGGNILNDNELLNEILRAFEDNDFSKLENNKPKTLSKHQVYAVDKKFKAGEKNRTVANYVATSLKTPAVQIEFSRSNRDPKNAKNLESTIKALSDIVNNVSNLVDIRERNTAQIECSGNNTILRKSASDKSSEITKVNKGSYVNILEETNSVWSKIKYEDNIGYVKTKELIRVGQITNVKSHIIFREEAKLSSNQIARIHKDECITILQEEKNGWLKVSYGGTEGYVIGKYVKNVNPDTVIKDDISKIDYLNKMTVTGVISALNLRESASTNSNIISKIKNREQVNILKEANSTWTKVAYKNNIGYVSSKYLK